MKKNKYIFLTGFAGVFMGLMTVGISGCAGESDTTLEQTEVSETTEETQAVTPTPEIQEETAEEEPIFESSGLGNRNNAGIYATTGDLEIFFDGVTGMVYESDAEADLSNGDLLFPAQMTNMYVCDGKLYGLASLYDQNAYLVCIDEDGQYEKLWEEPVSIFDISDGVIYFADAEDGYLHKLDPDTGREETLLEANVGFPFEYEGCVYYTLTEDDNSLYRMETESGEGKRVARGGVYWPATYDHYIYYLKTDGDDASIYRLDTDTLVSEKVADEFASNLNIYKDRLYYIPVNEEGAQEAVIEYIDLTADEPEAVRLDLSDKIRTAMREYEDGDYTLESYSRINLADDKLMVYASLGLEDVEYVNQYIYDPDSDELTMLDIQKSLSGDDLWEAQVSLFKSQAKLTEDLLNIEPDDLDAYLAAIKAGETDIQLARNTDTPQAGNGNTSQAGNNTAGQSQNSDSQTGQTENTQNTQDTSDSNAQTAESSQTETAAQVSSGFDEARAREAFDAVNAYRTSQGLPALNWSGAIYNATCMRAPELVTSFSHTRPDGSTPFTALSAAGAGYGWAGENIAAGYSSGQSVADGWWNSPGHKANILTSEYSNSAVACYVVGSTCYWVQLFTD